MAQSERKCTLHAVLCAVRGERMVSAPTVNSRRYTVTSRGAISAEHGVLLSTVYGKLTTQWAEGKQSLRHCVTPPFAQGRLERTADMRFARCPVHL